METIRKNFKSIRGSKTWYGLILFVLLLVPIVLIVLPSDFFDGGQSLCLSTLIFNQSCYACGLTRATQHLIHLEFAEAYKFNKLSFLVFPLLIWLWFSEVKKAKKKLQPQ